MVGITLQDGPSRRINYVKHRADPVRLQTGDLRDEPCWHVDARQWSGTRLKQLFVVRLLTTTGQARAGLNRSAPKVEKVDNYYYIPRPRSFVRPGLSPSRANLLYLHTTDNDGIAHGVDLLESTSRKLGVFSMLFFYSSCIFILFGILLKMCHFIVKLNSRHAFCPVGLF